MKQRSLFSRIFLGLILFIAAAIVGFIVWAGNPAGPSPAALVALDSDSGVRVRDFDRWIQFQPQNNPRDTAFIFYPGGRVDYRSYAPVLHAIAEQGYPVYLVRMPLSLAVFSPGRAAEVIRENRQIRRWVIGGHSLGGAMAANYFYNNPNLFRGLALWAAYPTESNNLSSSFIPALSLYGSLDGLATPADIEASKQLMPPDTRYVEIVGGNHAQFGSYGPQNGDNPAEISAEEQQSQIVAATTALLKFISGE